MKTKFTLVVAVLISAISIAQQGINYKALIKDANGIVLINTTIDIRVTIEKSNGTGIYQETHDNISTNSNGLLIINIGEGTTPDSFTDIDWKSDAFSLKTEIDIENDGTFLDLGTTPFNAVPYALSSADNTWVKSGVNTYTSSEKAGVNTATPDETLDVNGRIKVGDIDSTSQNTEGSIRYNSANKDFEGWNGSAWLSLTKAGNGWGNQMHTENSSQSARNFAYDNGTLAILTEGYVDIYDYNDRVFSNHQVITDDEGDPLFGYQIALHNNRLLVSAYTRVFIGLEPEFTYYVYVYEKQNGIWVEQTIINDPVTNPTTTSTAFGSNLDIFNNLALISDTSYNNYAGRVYLYELVSGNWNLIKTFYGNSPTDGFNFGENISISGNNISIIERENRKVYLYKDSGGIFGWVNAGSLSNPNGGVSLAYTVDIDNNRLVVTGFDDTYIYEKTNGSWNSNPSHTISGYGFNVKLNGNYLSIQKNDAIYLFEYNNGSWGEITQLTSTGGYFDYNRNLEITDDNIIIACYNDNSVDDINFSDKLKFYYRD